MVQPPSDKEARRQGAPPIGRSDAASEAAPEKEASPETGKTGVPAGPAGAKRPPGDGRRAVQEERRRFKTEVERQQARRERFRREGFRGFWFGLSAFGMVGWSIAVPTLLGVALGLWLDRRLGGGMRYTLSLMVAGLAVGMSNVWRWIRLQQEADETAGGAESDEDRTSG